jgi:hypothetical protein
MPADRVAWRLTDTARDQLSRCLLGLEPERGAALLGPRHRRLVTHVLPDPESAASYGHSATLRALLAAVLEAHPALEYRGTAHTHPGTMAEPSSQDRKAFRAVLEANPVLGDDVLFPVVVARPAAELDDVVAAWGSEHLLPLDGGTLGGYGLAGSGPADGVVPVAVSVLGVGGLVERLCAATDRVPHQAGVVREACTDEVWLRYVLAATGSTEHQVLVHPDFPTRPPMLATGSAPFRTPAWDLSLPEPERVAVAARVLEEST